MHDGIKSTQIGTLELTVRKSYFKIYTFIQMTEIFCDKSARKQPKA